MIHSLWILIEPFLLGRFGVLNQIFSSYGCDMLCFTAASFFSSIFRHCLAPKYTVYWTDSVVAAFTFIFLFSKDRRPAENYWNNVSSLESRKKSHKNQTRKAGLFGLPLVTYQQLIGTVNIAIHKTEGVQPTWKRCRRLLEFLIWYRSCIKHVEHKLKH